MARGDLDGGIERDLLAVIVELDAVDLEHVIVVAQATPGRARIAERCELEPRKIFLRLRSGREDPFAQLRQGHELLALPRGILVGEERDRDDRAGYERGGGERRLRG